MGGRYEKELCLAILEEFFGSGVVKVGDILLREPCPLPALCSRVGKGVPPLKVRKALAVLIHHNLVTFEYDPNHRICYTIHRKAIISLSKAPRCITMIKTVYGNVGELICEELIAQGRLTCSDAIRCAAARTEKSFEEVKERFCRLAEAQFIARCPPIEDVLRGCPTFSREYDRFILPNAILQSSTTEKGESDRKRKVRDDGDEGIYWCINWSRFDVHTRDELVREHIATLAGNTERTRAIVTHTVWMLLKLNELRSTSLASNNTVPMSVVDILRCAKENEVVLERADVEWSLRTLVEESNDIIRRSGDSAGGIYVIDLEKAIGAICQNNVQSLITEEIDGKACRIFRLLQSRGYLEEDQIEKLCVMDSKETRSLLYSMLEEGYLFTKPIAKTTDFCAARSFYLYHVDMPRTMRGLIESTCKIIRNLMLRCKEEERKHRSILERQMKMDSIKNNIQTDPSLDEATREQQIAEVQEMYSSAADIALLSKFKRCQTMLMSAQSECEKTLFAFYLYLDYAKRRC